MKNKMTKTPDCKLIQERFAKAFDFNQQIGLYDRVKVNEDFFIGNQWEGVESNGLPTPTFNFLKQVVLFQVSTITSDNLSVQTRPMPSASPYTAKQLEQITEIINHQFAAIVERNRIVTKNREFLRNAAVDGDGCMFFRFDPDVENGQSVKGEIVAEIIENTRVHFGNPNCREVQEQPYIIISKRELVDEVRYMAEKNKEAGECDIEDLESIKPDSEKWQNKHDSYTDDKVTVLTYLYKNRDTGTIWCVESTENGIIRNARDTGYKLYPLVWINWDYIHDCYHGQAMITGLIPNQKFINKMFAMVGISLLTTAFPKVIFDRNRIRSWDGSVGTAVGVQGSVADVAKVIDGASVNPQIAQFMELCIQKTRSFLGASDVAMGDSRPDNTSAIIALQRAANTPMEMTKQNLFQCVEDMGRIWMDMMATNYGERKVEVSMPIDEAGAQPLGMNLNPGPFMVNFNFARLREIQVAIRQDVGASSYWSEIANMQTLDNLLMNKQITLKQYLERVPNGYIAKKQELLAELSAPVTPEPPNTGTGMSVVKTSGDIPVPVGGGNGALQRAINREGVE